MTALLPVDPGYAFDYLAILEVKLQRGLPVRQELQKVEQFLARQFVVEEVKRSQEYLDLIHVNATTFDMIEKAHKDEVSASAVQKVNHERYLAKKALQNRFWPESELAERKTTIEKTSVRR